MRITRLELTDYKCFSHFKLDGIGQRVVLVGPNGCGKSAVLEAITALKELTGTYGSNETQYSRHFPELNKHALGWPSDLPLPIRAKCDSATITGEFAFNGAEKKLAGCDATTVSIRIDRSGEVSRITEVTEGIRKLFRHYDPGSGVGVIDYISPHRTFPLQRITSLNAQTLSVQQQRQERIEFQKSNLDYNKFKTIKSFIINQELADTSFYRQTQTNRDSLGILREIFSDCFGPKALTEWES